MKNLNAAWGFAKKVLDLGPSRNIIYSSLLCAVLLLAWPTLYELIASRMELSGHILAAFDDHPITGTIDAKEVAEKAATVVSERLRPSPNAVAVSATLGLLLAFATGVLGIVGFVRNKPAQACDNCASMSATIANLQSKAEVSRVLRRQLQRATDGRGGREGIETPLNLLSGLCSRSDPPGKAWAKIALWDAASQRFSVNYWSKETPNVERDYRVAIGEGGIGEYVSHAAKALEAGTFKIPRPEVYLRDRLVRLAPTSYRDTFDATRLAGEACLPLLTMKRYADGRIQPYVVKKRGKAYLYLQGVIVFCTDSEQVSECFDPDKLEQIERATYIISRILHKTAPGESYLLEVPPKIWQNEIQELHHQESVQ